MYIVDSLSVESRLLRELSCLSDPSPVNETVDLHQTLRKLNETSVWDDHDTEVQLNNASKKGSSCSKQTSGMIALKEYLNQDLVIRKSDPLLWWRNKISANPLLKGLSPAVKKYLCLTATSCPSEELFSVAGQVDSPRRNQLDPNNMNMILFLSKNT